MSVSVPSTVPTVAGPAARSRRNLRLSIAAILFVAGCSGPGAPPAGSTDPEGDRTSPPVAGGPAATIDSCTLLSDEEIEAATGEAVVTGTASSLTQVFASVCDIELDGDGLLTILPCLAVGCPAFTAPPPPSTESAITASSISMTVIKVGVVF